MLVTHVPRTEVARYLNIVRDLGATARITDMHVHATEVIHAGQRYAGDASSLLSVADAAPYRPPTLAPLRLSVPAAAVRMSPMARNRLSQMLFERAFEHTGATVIHDQMDLSGVAHALLLPVATSVAPIEAQMSVLSAIQNASSRVSLGYCIPSDVDSANISSHLAAAAMRWPIAAVKLHPNLSGIDLASDAGIDRVHSIIQACGELRLPTVVHGGCSPILGDSPAAGFAAIDRLAAIDWSVTRSPVIIAHFGVYGCGGHASHAADFGAVNRLLDQYSNLYLDTSGVAPDVVQTAMSRVDTRRLVFGSDALYMPMWQALASVCHALSGLHDSAACDTLIEITSSNPQRILEN
jgi:hypothetical protein